MAKQHRMCTIPTLICPKYRELCKTPWRNAVLCVYSTCRLNSLATRELGMYLIFERRSRTRDDDFTIQRHTLCIIPTYQWNECDVNGSSFSSVFAFAGIITPWFIFFPAISCINVIVVMCSYVFFTWNHVSEGRDFIIRAQKKLFPLFPFPFRTQISFYALSFKFAPSY